MSQLHPQKTPLCDEHLQLGAKMVDFAGWYMPVDYFGIRAEHSHVRTKVGLFDVSHMGEIRVRGPKAKETLQWLTSNDLNLVESGKAQYGLLMNPQGGIVDDLIVYCIEKDRDYLVCVNASNTKKDWDYFVANNRGADLSNESETWGQIAVQGPSAVALVAKVFGNGIKDVKTFHFVARTFGGDGGQGLCYLARTGYTGEDGFEIFVPRDLTVVLWRKLLRDGEEFEVKPIGLGARDTLRTEMKYSLYGQEIDDTTSPFDAGLGWAVKIDAKDFIGREALKRQRAIGQQKKLVGFKLLDKGIPRHDYKVLGIDKQEIGKVTSGTVSPTLNESIGIAYIHPDYAQIGREIFVDIRGRPARAVIVETPFVKTVLTKKK